MPARACPKCQRDGRFLEDSSREGVVSYYRCDACRHVWCFNNNDRLASPRDVTKPTDDRELSPFKFG